MAEFINGLMPGSHARFLNKFKILQRARGIDVERNRGHLSCHFENIKDEIRKSMADAGSERALILGAGHCRDIPLEGLTAKFNEVIMADLDHESMKVAAAGLTANLMNKVKLIGQDISLIALNSVPVVDQYLESSKTPQEFVEHLNLKLPKIPEGSLPFADASIDLIVSSMLMPNLPASFDDYAIEAACGKFGVKEDEFRNLYFSQSFARTRAKEIYRKHVDELHRIVRPHGRVVLVSEVVSSDPSGEDHFTLGYSDLNDLTVEKFETFADRTWSCNRPPYFDHLGEDLVYLGSKHQVQSLILKKRMEPANQISPFGPRSLGAAQNKDIYVRELLEGLKGISQLFVDKSLADAKTMIKAKVLKFLERANRATTAEDQNYIIEIMLEAMGRHHPMTLVHQKEVARCAGLIANELDLSSGETDMIKRAALLHDIGKLGETEELLNNTDELTEKERAVIQQHVVVGALLLHEITWLKDVSLPVYFSHYYKNYPTGVNLQKAPLSARIIAVADSFNAMVSERKYQKPLTPWKAVHKLRRKIYDQKIVDVLGKVLIGEKYGEIKLFSAILAHEINNALNVMAIVQLYNNLKEDGNYKEVLLRIKELTLMVNGYVMGTSDLTIEELLPSLEQKALSLKPVWLKLCESGKISGSDISDMEIAIQRTLDHIRRYMKFDPIEILMLSGQTERAFAKIKLLPKENRSKLLEEICQRQTERANGSGGFKFGRPFVEFLIRIANDVELKEYPAIQDVVQKSRSSIKDQELIRQFKDL